ncbi:sugar transferase [Dactylosporangium siamense]|uniref:Polyprenyl glycosylphosphotransferase n=1 Tax=Dactylosporangium siamense TaxID=685454 RepID=A0A919U8F8_9ACTN|nr:sugar transferase [Dactylosporangium siamense]GIG46524.1 polyprenyl glycosylphosphotransferase [Dactylosporangium siamense]
MGELDSFEILPEHALTPLGPNGVPRSGWQRARRASRWHRPYAGILLLLDTSACVLASVTARTFLDTKTNEVFEKNPGLFTLITFGLLPAVWLLVLWGHGAYDRRYLGTGTDEFKRVVRASWTVVAIVAFAAFSTKTQISRTSVGAALVGGLLYVLILRYLARRGLQYVRTRFNLATHRMLLVGTLQEALEVHQTIARDPAAGLVPVGIHLIEGYAPHPSTVTPVPVHAGRDILSLVRELNADTIAVCGSASAEPVELRRLAWQLEGTGIDLAVAPQLTDIAGPRVHIRPIEGIPLLYVEEPKLSGLGWLFKNVIDRVFALIALLIVLPFFPLVAIAIKLSDPGPIFFRQPRIGREGKMFKVWKLRTMYVDAEERQATLDEQNESDGLLFKMKNDPRVFKVGKWLRATSIDELPQILNVLAGEMSLVGPRPLPADDGDFLGDVRRRLLVRPGITGLWQVSGRSDLSWDDAVRLDLYYVDNWSLVLDLHTLWRTIGVVVFRKGAY